MKQQQQWQQKQWRNKKRQIEKNNIEEDECEYDNNVNKRKLPATIHNNNEEEKADNDNNNKNINDKDDNGSPRHLLLNCTDNDLDVPSKKRNQTPIGNEIGGEVAKLQATEHLVSPNNLITNCHNDYYKCDYHKHDADLPLYKLDPFITGACQQVCQWETIPPL